jgi:NitT/TauT family transport system substrate-binding protein
MKRFLAALALAMTFASCAGAETLKVAIAQRGFWNSTFIDIGLKHGWFKEAKGMPVKIISAEATGASDIFWYSKPDSGIRTAKDLNGRTMAFSSPGSSSNLIALQLIAQENVKPKLVATGGLPGTLTQVMSGQIDTGWAVPPFVLQQLADGKLQIVARGSDVRELANQTVRVNVANANALKTKRDAFVTFVKVLSRSIDWAYANDQSLDDYAVESKSSRALAQRTRDEFFPKPSLQLAEVKGLDLSLKQALEFKYITSPLSKDEVQRNLIDILYKP